MILLDTSIILACLFEEGQRSRKAEALLESGKPLGVSDIVHMEIANALTKSARRGRISPEQAQAEWQWWIQLRQSLPVHATDPCMGDAIAFCLHHQRHLYDLLHVMAARQCGGHLVTADDALIAGLRGTSLEKWVATMDDVL